MANRLTKTKVDKTQLIIFETIPGESVIMGDTGEIKHGQVLAQEETTGKWFKYNKNGSEGKQIPRRVYKGETFTCEDNSKAVVFRSGLLDKALVVGIELTDYKGIAELERNGIYLEEVK